MGTVQAQRSKKPRGAESVAVLLVAAAFISLASWLVFFAPGRPPAPVTSAPLTTWQVSSGKYFKWACKSKETLDRLFSLGDDSINAQLIYLTAQMRSGACRDLERGAKVHLDEASMFGSPCVRLEGESTCYYVARSTIEPSPQ
jgi:hypothetical protein